MKTPELGFAGVAVSVLAVALTPAAKPSRPPKTPAAPKISFNRDVRPLLSEHCYRCHGPSARDGQAGLRLDDAKNATRDRGGHFDIDPGHADKSMVIGRITTDVEAMQMPPKASGVKPLTKAEAEIIKAWINQGATYEKHWAFVPPVQSPVPNVKDAKWERNFIDAFVLQRLEAEGLKPSPEADRATLLRRASLTLTGLPPTPAEIEMFLHDSRKDAYERAVDRLMSSPRYGEHQARYWLDAVRYSDTHGMHFDNERAVFPYRDWVVRAMNDDLPYDKFSLYQLAGDLLPNPTTDMKIATAYVRLNPTSNEGGAIEAEFLVKNTFDRVDTTSTVFLGLTAGCAKCHDHKYDPIRQQDYYQLFAFFNSTADTPFDGNLTAPPPAIKLPTDDERRRLDTLTRQVQAEVAACPIDAVKTWIDANRTPPSKQKPGPIQDAIAALDKIKSETDRTSQARQLYLDQGPVTDVTRTYRTSKASAESLDKSIPSCLVAQELPQPRPAFVLRRGEYTLPTTPVTRDIPAVFGALGNPKANRLDLARWITSPQNPLFARVIVNRVWQQHFGTGLVKTSEDFGIQGDWPSHPELLDTLAVRFIEDGYSLKKLNRLIVTSAAFRQSSASTALNRLKDPENRLVSRGPRFRLDAEVIRDQALYTGGLLREKSGGRGFRPYQPAGLWEDVAYPDSDTGKYKMDVTPEIWRRSLYLFWKRTSPHPVMLAFDAPSRESCVVRRSRTNTPLQSLAAMNEPGFLEAARVFGERIVATEKSTPDRLRFAFETAVCRAPTAAEQKVLLAAANRYLDHYRADPDEAEALRHVGIYPRRNELPAPEVAAWMLIGSTLINLDEFLTQH